jgi:sugar (pentulose or hexulose) kinase
MKYCYTIEMLETLTGRRIDTVNIMGGGSQDAFCCQLAANALNRRVICGPIDASSIGNIMVQMLAHGEIGSIDEGREIIVKSFEIKELLPVNPQSWIDRYDIYKNLFTAIFL